MRRKEERQKERKKEGKKERKIENKQKRKKERQEEEEDAEEEKGAMRRRRISIIGKCVVLFIKMFLTLCPNTTILLDYIIVYEAHYMLYDKICAGLCVYM